MTKKEKDNNDIMLQSDITEIETVISRLKEALQVKSDGQMATYLGISRQNIGAARKRGDIPPGWINKVAELTGFSMDWLCFGNGPKMRVEYVTAGSAPGGRAPRTQSCPKLSAPTQNPASSASANAGSRRCAAF